MLLYKITIVEQISLGNLADTFYESLPLTDSESNFRIGPCGPEKVQVDSL